MREELDRLAGDEEIFWAQREKQKWLTLGNRNTRYFHKAATIRCCRNRSLCLKNEEGWFCVLKEPWTRLRPGRLVGSGFFWCLLGGLRW